MVLIPFDILVKLEELNILSEDNILTAWKHIDVEMA